MNFRTFKGVHRNCFEKHDCDIQLVMGFLGLHNDLTVMVYKILDPSAPVWRHDQKFVPKNRLNCW